MFICLDNNCRTAESFVTKFGVVICHHKLGFYSKKTPGVGGGGILTIFKVTALIEPK